MYNLSKQYRYIDYIKDFAEFTGIPIFIGGSFSKNSATKYSDIDIYFISNDEKAVKDFIYGYDSLPVYISNTTNPNGIIIVVYQNGISIDLSVGYLSIWQDYKELFYKNDFDNKLFTLNSDIHKKIILSDRWEYRQARLFHRSLIKYLSGKKSDAFRLLTEIAEYIDYDYSGLSDYKKTYELIYNKFSSRYMIPPGLKNELENLYKEIQYD